MAVTRSELQRQLTIKENQLENLKKQKQAEDSSFVDQIGVRLFNKEPASVKTQKQIEKVEREIIHLNAEIANQTTIGDRAEGLVFGAKKFFSSAVNFFDFRSEEVKHAERQHKNHLEALEHKKQREELRKQIDLLRRPT